MSKLPIELDKIDRQLLNLLQKDNQLSAVVLAEKVGSSRSSVQRRIKRLRNEGVIAADISILSPKIVADKILTIVEVKLESVRSDLLNEFRQTMLKLDQVQQCYFISGKVDFIVMLSTDTLQEYEAFARQYFADAPNVKRYQSNIVSDRVKVGLHVPLKLSQS
ncbi:putative HTH-type transcriptional regulator y4tD [Terasakiella brassicae]|uniref:HTH-type transcriptional regulator y4tD n=1 Tax=Terasakiella brassicae TaxID=1634917 RepID=A0A917C2Q8_9PROT|nr:Lrp/AsnC family transcriptional regulator [Terasakiella brassicae]GGF69089.1 putative HTH-type transcriptional regulator y4tD [Terasakiella brassicae]